MAIKCNKYHCTSNEKGTCVNVAPAISLKFPVGECASYVDSADKVLYGAWETEILAHPLVVAAGIIDVESFQQVNVGVNYDEYVYGNLKVRMNPNDPTNPVVGLAVKGLLSKLSDTQFKEFIGTATNLTELVCYDNAAIVEFLDTDTSIDIDLLVDGVWFKEVVDAEWFDLP